MCSKAKWIWYDNDFEHQTYHKVMMKRQQRKDLLYPCWKIDRINQNVVFVLETTLEKDIEAELYYSGKISINIDSSAWNVEDFNGKLQLKAGKKIIRISLFSEEQLPCLFIDNEYLKTDERWSVSSLGSGWKKATCNDLFASKEDNPNNFKLPTIKRKYLLRETYKNGYIYDFGQEMIAFPVIKLNCDKKVELYYGESYEEAKDFENSEVCDGFVVSANQEQVGEGSRAFRYIYISDVKDNVEDFYVLEEKYYGSKEPYFISNNDKLNDIYNISLRTLELTSREVFIDGAKRDRWTWAGDVLQSLMFDFYSFFDIEIVKRTLIALGGKNEWNSNVNTILDYNFYFILSIYKFYYYTKDKQFLINIYPRIKAVMKRVLTRLDAEGFIKPNSEWVFIDWANIEGFEEANLNDRTCFLQLLFYETLNKIYRIEEIIEVPHEELYVNALANLKSKINEVFWNDEIGGFYHDYNKKLITRYANIFAVLFNFTDDLKRNKIKDSILFSSRHPEIYTPYMKFYELCAFAELGNVNKVIEFINSYWGGMVDEGVTSFWEEFNPQIKGNEKYAMYGRKYGKSLCHSWGAGPLYLIGHYVVGLKPLNEGYDEFYLEPYLGELYFNAKLPLKKGYVSVNYSKDKLEIITEDIGGKLVIKTPNVLTKENEEVKKKTYDLSINNTYVFELNKL